jgi:hypothetical protein
MCLPRLKRGKKIQLPKRWTKVQKPSNFEGLVFVSHFSHATHIRCTINAYNIFVRNLKEESNGSPMRGHENATEMNHEEMEWGGVGPIRLLQDRNM